MTPYLFASFFYLIVFGLPCGMVLGQSTLPPHVNLLIRGAPGQDYLLSFHCLSLSVSPFSLSLSSTLFLFEGISQNILHLEYTC